MNIKFTGRYVVLTCDFGTRHAWPDVCTLLRLCVVDELWRMLFFLKGKIWEMETKTWELLKTLGSSGQYFCFYTYIYIDSVIWEDLDGWFLSGWISVEFKVPTIPLDWVKRSIFEIVLAQELRMTALSYDRRNHCQVDILQTVAIWKEINIYIILYAWNMRCSGISVFGSHKFHMHYRLNILSLICNKAEVPFMKVYNARQIIPSYLLKAILL